MVLWLQSNVKYESNRVELRSGHAIYERRFLVWIWRRKEKWRPWWLFLFVCVRHCLATGFSTNHNRPTQNASETCVYMTCRAFWKRSDKANWMQNTRIDKIAVMRSFEITESGPLSRRFKPHFGKNKLRSKKMTSFWFWYPFCGECNIWKSWIWNAYKCTHTHTHTHTHTQNTQTAWEEEY